MEVDRLFHRVIQYDIHLQSSLSSSQNILVFVFSIKFYSKTSEFELFWLSSLVIRMVLNVFYIESLSPWLPGHSLVLSFHFLYKDLPLKIFIY